MTGLPIDRDGHIRAVLDYLGEALEPSILIGGWATHLRVGGDISLDIDLIIGAQDVRTKIHSVVEQVSTSSHLQGRKWRGAVDGVHVDIYLPHESQLGGKLRLKVEVLAEFTEPLGHGKWRTLTIEAHTISKVAALLDRPDTEKGSKDARELVLLVEQGVEPARACAILVAATAGPVADLPEHLDTAFELLGPRAGLNKAQRKWLHQLRREWTGALAEAITRPERARPALE